MNISPWAFSIFLFVSSKFEEIFTSEISYLISLKYSFISIFFNSFIISSGAFSQPLFLFMLPEEVGIFVRIIIVLLWKCLYIYSIILVWLRLLKKNKKMC